MIHQSTWHKATLGGIAGFVLVMNLAGCGDISSTTSAARSSANAMATHIDSGLSGGTQDDAAQYAIDNVKADWKAEALDAAKAYQKYTPMSDSELYDQLTSEYGSGFTPEEAQYAIDNLDK